MQIGDHLVTPRMGFTHHGLYLGNQQVIHYSGKSNGELGQIELVSLEEFCDGKPCDVRDYIFRVYGRKESVLRAHERLGEAKYSILFNNCEQFVTWCIMGFGYSEQLLNTACIAVEVAPILKQTIQHIPTMKPLIESSFMHETVKTGLSTIIAASTTTTLSGACTTALTAVAGGISAATLTSLAMPISVGALIGYGMKRVFDWFD